MWGSTDKFSTAILAHLFCPHFVGKSSTELLLCVRVASSFGLKNLRQSDGLHVISDSPDILLIECVDQAILLRDATAPIAREGMTQGFRLA